MKLEEQNWYRESQFDDTTQMICSKPGETIAELTTQYNSLTKKRIKENADLFCAAPKLLKVCKETLDRMDEDTKFGDNSEDYFLRAKLRAAIVFAETGIFNNPESEV